MYDGVERVSQTYTLNHTTTLFRYRCQGNQVFLFTLIHVRYFRWSKSIIDRHLRLSLIFTWVLWIHRQFHFQCIVSFSPFRFVRRRMGPTFKKTSIRVFLSWSGGRQSVSRYLVLHLFTCTIVYVLIKNLTIVRAVRHRKLEHDNFSSFIDKISSVITLWTLLPRRGRSKILS